MEAIVFGLGLTSWRVYELDVVLLQNFEGGFVLIRVADSVVKEQLIEQYPILVEFIERAA